MMLPNELNYFNLFTGVTSYNYNFINPISKKKTDFSFAFYLFKFKLLRGSREKNSDKTKKKRVLK